MARVRENERSLTTAGTLAAPEDFSLVLGGPLYQLWRRLHISGAGLELLVRRMLVIPLVAWLGPQAPGHARVRRAGRPLHPGVPGEMDPRQHAPRRVPGGHRRHSVPGRPGQ